MLRTHSVRWPLSFLTSARNLPSPDKAILSNVPVFVIWLSATVVKGTGRGHNRQAANPAAARSARTMIAMGKARDFFAGGGPRAAAKTAPAALPLEGTDGGGTLPFPAPLGLEPGPPALAGELALTPPAAIGRAAEPPLLLRCNRFRSARSSAADCRRSSRSLSSVLLSVSSNSGGSSGLRVIGAVGA